VAQDEIARLGERGFDGVVLEDCGGAERRDDEGRGVAGEGWERAEDVFDDGDADEGAEEGEEVV